MIKKYDSEFEGQKEFYSDYLKLINNVLKMENVLSDNTDGVLNGNLVEFKLNINDLNVTLFQAIKYLSARRIKGKPIPANIVLIALNEGKCYIYDSIDYLKEIETVYLGGASKGNEGFQGNTPKEVLDYITNGIDQQRLIEILRTDRYTKINIDENNIVGWASSYYRNNPSARKSDFIGDTSGKVKIIGEIRQPSAFKEYLNAYEGDTNIKFQYLMDKLNDTIQKKDLGAFYTPTLYATKSLELLRQAIDRVPKGNDYIILDRCSGTGNLEKYMTDEELSHAVLSTVEYYEYKVLLELLGDKVRYIVPPVEKEDTFNMGLVRGADALSEEFLNNDVINEYLEDEKVTIIMMENPPYAEVNGTTRKDSRKALWKDSYLVNRMKEDVGGRKTNDLGSVFIWSAFKYYLRQPTDSYIVYSPVKYWKSQHIVDKKFVDGFAFNRKHFHAPTPACIMCALWSNEDDLKTNEISLKAFDIKDNELIYEGDIPVKRVYSTLSQAFYDKSDYEGDTLDGVATELNGTESFKTDKQIRVKTKQNENIVGYLVANMSGFDNPRLNAGLTVAGRYDGNGFFLREKEYLEKLPLFASARYTDHENNWKIMSLIMKSADKSEEYKEDVNNKKLEEFLLKNLLWTSLTHYSHMRSFKASNNVLYINEISLDDTNGETLAIKDLKKLVTTEKEANLLKQWKRTIESAKKTKEYDDTLTYGTYQIDKELNTFETELRKGKKEKTYNYPELNGHLATLKVMVNDYYLTELVDTLFEYEFLK